jgi:transcriptional regulator with XRE-family HTH domain
MLFRDNCQLMQLIDNYAMYIIHRAIGKTLEYIRKIIAKNLFDLRESHGLNQTQLSKKTGIGQSSLSRYEADGWVSDPVALEKLASFYGVRSSRFFYDPEMDKRQAEETWTKASLAIPKKELIKDLQAIIDKLSN